MTPETTRTIEQTGKEWKATQLVGVLVTVFGLMMLCNAWQGPPDDGSGMKLTLIVLIAGLGLYLVGRIGAWWHHG